MQKESGSTLNSRSNGRPRKVAAALGLCAALLGGCRSPHKVELTISVAASLTGTIEQVEGNYSRLHPEISFRNNFGSSGMLARQIEQGAPVDLLLSAGAKPVDELAAKGRIATGQNRILLRNHLVLIAPAGSSLGALQDLSSSTVKRIALGDPQSVPAGNYALQTLHWARLDQTLESKFVFAKDVRQVLAYVESGNVDAGFVYATDARQDARIRIVERVDDAAHEPIVYPLAVLSESPHAREAQAFADFLFTADAARIFAAQGFSTGGQP